MTKKPTYLCKGCGASFRDKSDQSRHRLQCDKVPFHCDYCDWQGKGIERSAHVRDCEKRKKWEGAVFDRQWLLSQIYLLALYPKYPQESSDLIYNLAKRMYFTPAETRFAQALFAKANGSAYAFPGKTKGDKKTDMEPWEEPDHIDFDMRAAVKYLLILVPLAEHDEKLLELFDRCDIENRWMKLQQAPS